MYTCPRENKIERLDVLPNLETGLQGFARNLYTVNVQREVIYVKMLEIKRVEHLRTIKSSIVHETDQDSSR